MSSRIKRIAILLFALVCTTGVVCGFAVYREQATGEAKMTALMRGDSTVRFSSFEIHNGLRQVHCTDRVVLDYLADAMRRYNSRGVGVGVTYQATFRFEGGGVFNTYMYRIDDGFSISMPALAAEESFPTHEIYLPAPMPDDAEKMVRFLTDPWKKVPSKTLELSEPAEASLSK